MARKSAGLLMYRRKGKKWEVFLAHPGGPLWARKDEGAWTIPKGEFRDEDPLQAARREFEEETGIYPEGKFFELSPQKQPGGKVVHAWAFEGDCDPSKVKSNIFSMEWPPRSGKFGEFPEVDRAEWFDLETAKRKILKGQSVFLEELKSLLDT